MDSFETWDCQLCFALECINHRSVQPVSMLSSDLACSASMCAYNRLATAPPAEWPVIRSEHVLREGSSSRRDRRRAATGLIIFLATDRKPAWVRLPGSSFISLIS